VTALFFILFFIFGTIVGSFLNVFILRYNTGLSFMKGRSKCFSCGKKLFWHELVPVISYLFLKGKCSECKSKISAQYPLIELLTGILFVAIFWKIGLTLLLPFYLFLGALLVAISVYDFMHKIIPDGMVFTFDIVARILLFIKVGFLNVFHMPFFLDIFSGLILFAFFAFLWLVSSGKWMGFGDAKLALGVGWLLGLSGGIMAIMLAFWIGAIVSLLLLAFQKLNLSRLSLTIKSEIPFAPFIILGLFLEFFTNWGASQASYLFNIFR
jgi:leader peptidase (prepilin peptidase)/N-methyltransferase